MTIFNILLRKSCTLSSCLPRPDSRYRPQTSRRSPSCSLSATRVPPAPYALPTPWPTRPRGPTPLRTSRRTPFCTRSATRAQPASCGRSSPSPTRPHGPFERRIYPRSRPSGLQETTCELRSIDIRGWFTGAERFTGKTFHANLPDNQVGKFFKYDVPLFARSIVRYFYKICVWHRATGMTQHYQTR